MAASDETTLPDHANDTNRTHSLTLTVVDPGIVYVHDTAGGLNNGTSWADAYRDLNTAITNASPGSELWVAGGTYKPTGTDQGNSISLSKDLKLYGGFAGVATETALYQCDWSANVTTLSGDINVAANDTDNRDQVVTITNSSVVLDGFTITKGNGWIDGAGVYVEDCSPTIRNCLSTDNLCDGKDSYAEAGAQERDALGLKHIDIRTVTNNDAGTPAYFDMGAYEAAVEHTIFISVDGLASLYPDTASLMGTGSPAEKLDYLKRIKNEGAWTFDARSDPWYTETTPSHITMLTGRPVVQPVGWANTTHHGWFWNGEPVEQTWTLHGSYGTGQGNSNVSYEASVFDVVHDNDGTTGEYAGKDKFVLHEWSYDLVDGRADTVGVNTGRDKIDTFEWTKDADDWNGSLLVSRFIGDDKAKYDSSFVFLHLKGPDKYGHQNGSGSSAWNNAVEDVNERVATLFTMVESQSNKAWYGNTLIVLTADRGGHSSYGHGDETDQYNYSIPMGVWGHLVPPQVNLYTLATNRTNPVNARKDYHEAGQPIRHADGVDLCLNLMGLPSIDGASIKDMKFGR